MRVLIVAKNPVYLRNFESTVRLLDERGHKVHVALEKGQKKGREQTELLEGLRSELNQFSFGLAPRRQRTGLAALTRELRIAVDYLRFFHPKYDDAQTLRHRAHDTAPEWARQRADGWPWSTRVGRALLRRWWSALERSIPPPREIAAFVDSQDPDLVLVTPLVVFGTPQIDYVRAAIAKGVPTGVLVKSWDNLSSKGLLRETPDIVTVWNEAQKREAMELHGIPADRVVVTGAQAWDQWFERAPSTTKERFAKRVGLPPDRPFLLYLGTSGAIGREAPFVKRWVDEVRSSPALRDFGILIRPHPQVDASQWDELLACGYPDVVVYPRAGAEPVEASSKADYFDSMYHASAVIGINTSAMIESAIVGHQVFTVVVPEFRDWQEGTLHFQYLRDEGGGLLTVGQSLEEHAAQLSGAIAANGSGTRANPRALEALVRPFGLDQPATPRIVDALEQVGSRPSVARYRPPVLKPLADRVIASRVGRYDEAVKEETRAKRASAAAAKASKRAGRSPSKAASKLAASIRSRD